MGIFRSIADFFSSSSIQPNENNNTSEKKHYGSCKDSPSSSDSDYESQDKVANNSEKTSKHEDADQSLAPEPFDHELIHEWQKYLNTLTPEFMDNAIAYSQQNLPASPKFLDFRVQISTPQLQRLKSIILLIRQQRPVRLIEKLYVFIRITPSSQVWIDRMTRVNNQLDKKNELPANIDSIAGLIALENKMIAANPASVTNFKFKDIKGSTYNEAMLAEDATYLKQYTNTIIDLYLDNIVLFYGELKPDSVADQTKAQDFLQAKLKTFITKIKKIKKSIQQKRTLRLHPDHGMQRNSYFLFYRDYVENLDKIINVANVLSSIFQNMLDFNYLTTLEDQAANSFQHMAKMDGLLGVKHSTDKMYPLPQLITNIVYNCKLAITHNDAKYITSKNIFDNEETLELYLANEKPYFLRDLHADLHYKLYELDFVCQRNILSEARVYFTGIFNDDLSKITLSSGIIIEEEEEDRPAALFLNSAFRKFNDNKEIIDVFLFLINENLQLRKLITTNNIQPQLSPIIQHGTIAERNIALRHENEGFKQVIASSNCYYSSPISSQEEKNNVTELKAYLATRAPTFLPTKMQSVFTQQRPPFMQAIISKLKRLDSNSQPISFQEIEQLETKASTQSLALPNDIKDEAVFNNHIEQLINHYLDSFFVLCNVDRHKSQITPILLKKHTLFKLEIAKLTNIFPDKDELLNSLINTTNIVEQFVSVMGNYNNSFFKMFVYLTNITYYSKQLLRDNEHLNAYKEANLSFLMLTVIPDLKQKLVITLLMLKKVHPKYSTHISPDHLGLTFKKTNIIQEFSTLFDQFKQKTNLISQYMRALSNERRCNKPLNAMGFYPKPLSGFPIMQQSSLDERIIFLEKKQEILEQFIPTHKFANKYNAALAKIDPGCTMPREDMPQLPTEYIGVLSPTDQKQLAKNSKKSFTKTAVLGPQATLNDFLDRVISVTSLTKEKLAQLITSEAKLQSDLQALVEEPPTGLIANLKQKARIFKSIFNIIKELEVSQSTWLAIIDFSKALKTNDSKRFDTAIARFINHELRGDLTLFFKNNLQKAAYFQKNYSFIYEPSHFENIEYPTPSNDSLVPMLDDLLITFQQRSQYCKDYFQCRMAYIVTKTNFNQPIINPPQTNAELIKDIARLKKERKDKIEADEMRQKLEMDEKVRKMVLERMKSPEDNGPNNDQPDHIVLQIN